MGFKAVIFDEGDLLYDASFWRKQLHSKLAEMGYKQNFYDMVLAWEEKLIEPYQGKKSYSQAFEEFISGLGFNQEQLKEIISFSDSLKEQVPSKRTLFPGEKETLQILKDKGVKLAILSDSESGEEFHRKTLEALEIGSFFEVIAYSCEIGFAKPEKEAYLFVVEKLGLAPEDIIFMSHDQEELDGAKEAGLTTVSFNDRVYSPTDNKADYSIKQFSALLPIVLENTP